MRRDRADFRDATGVFRRHLEKSPGAVEQITFGAHFAQRAFQLLKRVGFEPEVTFVGGMARQAGMVRALEAALGMPVTVPSEPDLVAAVGAALCGLQRMQRLRAEEGVAA